MRQIVVHKISGILHFISVVYIRQLITFNLLMPKEKKFAIIPLISVVFKILIPSLINFLKILRSQN